MERARASRGSIWRAALAVGLLLPAAAPAQEPAAPPAEAAPKLDKLLKLPNGVAYDVERRGGAGRLEWKERFADARKEIASAKKEVDAVSGKLEKAAVNSDQWRFVPPGGDVTAENQDNIRLRMDLEKRREDLARAERRLKDLEVEANLAAVPEDWR